MITCDRSQGTITDRDSQERSTASSAPTAQRSVRRREQIGSEHRPWALRWCSPALAAIHDAESQAMLEPTHHVKG